MNILIFAPHPDDELIGPGGYLLKKISEGHNVDCAFVTSSNDFFYGFENRQRFLESVQNNYGFREIFDLKFEPSRLDHVNEIDLIDSFKNIIEKSKPKLLMLPNRSDAHSDHTKVFDIAASCSKWFRTPFIKEVICYETISETDFNLNKEPRFQPNMYVDISNHIDKKISLINLLYRSEFQNHPFPRSPENIQALALTRGSQSGFYSAEAFQIIKKLED